MTCKEDCIHSGLCYKENNYENFPDRCGSFISNKVLEKRPQGKWKLDNIGIYCSECKTPTEYASNFCPNCGAKMKEVTNDYTKT